MIMMTMIGGMGLYCFYLLCGGYVVNHDDNKDDDDGYPANYHQSHYHQVGFCHNDKGWKYDTVKHLLAEYFPMARVELAIWFKGNQAKNVKGTNQSI